MAFSSTHAVLLFSVCFLSMWPLNHSNPENHSSFVAICAVIKNQHESIREWLQYHRWVGFNKVYIIDHRSLPPLSSHVADFVESGFVTIYYLNETFRGPNRTRGSPQLWGYDYCVRHYSALHSWMLIIDADEFLVLSNKSATLREVLQPFKPFGGVSVHMKYFGSSGHISPPAGSVLSSYTYFMPATVVENAGWYRPFARYAMKTFMNTEFLKGSCGPHTCTSFRPIVNTNHVKLDLVTAIPILWDKMAVHHYVLKSLTDFKEKMARGTGHSQYVSVKRGKTMDFFRRIDGNSTERWHYGPNLSRLCCSDELTAHKPFRMRINHSDVP